MPTGQLLACKGVGPLQKASRQARFGQAMRARLLTELVTELDDCS